MAFALSRTSKSRLKGVDTGIIRLINLALIDSPIDFGIPEHGGFRTTDEQKLMFDRGVSKCDGVKRVSAHQSGKAFDFYAYVDGTASWDKVHLAILYGVFAVKAKELDIELVWGGTFGSDIYHGWDMGHLERAKPHP
jgi:peptidoglycan L-alanyl-D-glutamate endopeptidase CwlK